MIGKLLGKVVDTGGDIIRRAQEGKISMTEAQAELEKLGLSLEQSVLEGQVGLNMLDAQSGDRFRTWWRPAACWMLLFVTAAIALTILVAVIAFSFGAPVDPVLVAESLAPLMVWVFPALLAVIGIREGGKAVGNK